MPDITLFNKALEALDPQLYETKYADLKSRQLIPSIKGGSGLNLASTVYTYEMADHVGSADFVSSRAMDLPSSDVKVEQFSTPIRKLATSFNYDLDEVNAMLSGRGMDIIAERLKGARKAMEQKMDSILAFGDTEQGLKGFLNNSAVGAANLTTGDWGNPSTSVDLIIADIAETRESIASATLEVEQPDTVILPPSAMRDLETRRIANTGISLMTYIKQTFPELSFQTWYKLETAGAASGRRMVMYRRSPEVVSAIIPQEFTRLPALDRAMFYQVACIAKIGGVVVRYPKAMLYRDTL